MSAPFTPSQPGVPPTGQETWLEAKAPDGKVYYYHSVTRQTSWTLPPGAIVMKPPQEQASQQQAAATTGHTTAHNAVAQAQAASQYQIGAPLNQGTVPSMSVSQQPPGFGAPPMNHPGGPMGQMQMPGPMGMPVPPPGMFGMPPNMGFPPFGFMPPVMPPVIQRGDPQDWNEYKTEDGRSYWYNSKLSRTTWEKPPEVAEYEQKRLAEGTTQKLEERPAEKKEPSTKPVATKQIPGTPWCVVWTTDKKSFFHNPSTKASVWKRPPELLGMKEVDDILAMNPDDIVNDNLKPSTNGSNEQAPIKREAAQEDIFAKRFRAGSVEENSRDSFSDAGSEVSKPVRTYKGPQPQKEKPKDPAFEAEQKAAKDRETIPLEERIKTFKGLLAEKDISAFSTWEKELPKIVFDPRYLLLTSKERRDVFDEFTRDKTEKEREEKKKKLEESKESFRSLLREANLTSKTPFDEFAAKYKNDERYKAIERQKDRQHLFEDFLVDVRKKEKEARQAEREKIHTDFIELLQTVSGLNRKSHWSDVKKKIRDDPRYEKIDSSNQREEWFRDYVKTLPKKKDKDSEDDEKPEEGEAVEEDEDVKADREKKERVEASLRERQRQVDEEMSVLSKDREKEREHHRTEEAIQNYKALLVDLIKHTDLSYKEARKILKKDPRYELAEPLHKHQKEDIYQEHLDMLSAKKKTAYRELLDELDLDLDASWKSVRKKVRDDPRYTKFSSSETKCEKEFKKYLQDKTNRARDEFRELLKETKLIDYKTKSKIEESDQAIKDIVEILKNDKRYLILDPVSKERKEILADYIDDLARRGPPPPPTASEPSRRGK